VLQFQLFNDKTGEATGSLIPSSYYSLWTKFSYNGTDVLPGAWRIRASYENTFEEGSLISCLSEVFYIHSTYGGCKEIEKSITNGGTERLKELQALWDGVFVTLLFLSL
jgi:hypothetical protein